VATRSVPSLKSGSLPGGNKLEIFDGDLIEERLVLALRDRAILVAAASSSKNAEPMLHQIRLDTFAEKEGLHEKFITPGLTLQTVFDADVSGATSPTTNQTPRSS